MSSDCPSEDQSWPSWLSELDHALAFHPQFILAGNIRDRHLVPTADGLVLLPTIDAIWSLLEQRAYEYLLVYDPVDRLRIAKTSAVDNRPEDPLIQRVRSDGPELPFPALTAIARTIQESGPAQPPGALIIDYASRIASPLAGPNEELDEFFGACEKMSHRAQPRGSPGGRPPPYNPIIWLANNVADLPDWFRVGNEAVRTIVIGLPDRSTRRIVATRAAPRFADFASLSEAERETLILQFVLLTEGMTLRSMQAIQELAHSRGSNLGSRQTRRESEHRRSFGLAGIADAVRAYKVGSSNDPWADPTVRTSIQQGEARVTQHVKGQPQAIRLALDILKRSVTGLSGAHVARSGGRPRGVLFMAGPTGVGKTELAKQITMILFGDESAYHRFDMSEFSAEHSEARLIGAPPGYVGHDEGGELVNAVRERPFSVLLFDEIEKAHPRILDKFLQILEDGRLSDGHGDTVFFSESVIIFTSNLGIYADEEVDGVVRRVQKVTPENAPTQAEVDELVRPEIERHFRFVIQRPELLNRIGGNIIVFDFIRNEVAREIMQKMIGNVAQRVKEEHRVTLELSPGALQTLEAECMAEAARFGGRGVGNCLETCLVNPLGRALFDGDIPAESRAAVTEIIKEDGVWKTILA